MTRSKPVVPEPTANYPAQEHAELKRQVEDKFDLDGALEIADGWRAVGSQLTELAVDFSIIVNGSQAGWTGAAADGARSALAKVGSFSETTGEHFTATGDALHGQTNAAAEAKTRMPPPVPYDPQRMFAEALTSGSVLQVGALAFTVPAQRAKSEAAKEEAVAVMRSRDDALRAATTSMPQFAEMPSVTQEQGVATATTMTSSVSTGSVEVSSRVGTAGVTGTVVDRTTGNVITGTVVTSGVPGGTTNASLATPPTSTPNPHSTPFTPQHQTGQPGFFPGRQPSLRDPRTGRPLPLGGSGRGGPMAAGRGGIGGRGPSGGSSSGSGPGGNGPGGNGAGGNGGAGRSASLGGAGMSGRAPMTGFGPTGSGGVGLNDAKAGRGQTEPTGAAVGGAPGGRGDGGEDLEHEAKYLVPTDEHFGEDRRMVAPPVIGG